MGEEGKSRCGVGFCCSAACIDDCSPKPCPSLVLNLKGDRGDLGDLRLCEDFGPASTVSPSSLLFWDEEMASGCGVGLLAMFPSTRIPRDLIHAAP